MHHATPQACEQADTRQEMEVRDQDHAERMLQLRKELADMAPPPPSAPAGERLEVRSVHVEIHASSPDFIQFVIAELERQQIR